MKVYIVCEFLDYYNSDIVAVFSNEEDAKNYVQEHYWRDGDGDGIYYEEHEVKWSQGHQMGGRVIFGGNDANLLYHALAKKDHRKCEGIVKSQESWN